MRTSFATHSHTNIVNTKLHRATVVDLPEDCAPDGAGFLDADQLSKTSIAKPDVKHKEFKPPKADRTLADFFVWSTAAVFVVALFAGLLLVHWGVSK